MKSKLSSVLMVGNRAAFSRALGGALLAFEQLELAELEQVGEVIGVVGGGLGGHLLASAPIVGSRSALRWWRKQHERTWSRGSSWSCSFLRSSARGRRPEVGWVDGDGLEVRVAVEAEQPDRLLGVVEQDQRDRVGARRPDRERRIDRAGQLAEASRAP